ncbi:hypothetical protein [Streptomyces albogriseolus]|uniref:hypothetical protein n=1 Tax=Streptomyces albogriseolus TaxID=1887 RepID=UPI0033B974DC
MPEAPRHTRDTWIPNGPDAPPAGPASADPGHEGATLDHKTEAGRRTETSPSRGDAGSAVGLGESDAPRRSGGAGTLPGDPAAPYGRGGTETPSAAGATDTAHRSGSGTGTGPAGTGNPSAAAHPQTGDGTPAGTHGAASGTGDRTSVPGPDGTGIHTHGSGSHAADDHATTPGAHGETGASGHTGHHGPDARLLADDTCDRLSAQLRQAVAGFVDRPRDAVEEADLVLHEITERLTDALTERRRTLAQHWKAPASGDPKKGDAAPAADTEQLRLALRDYRELAERLLGV